MLYAIEIQTTNGESMVDITTHVAQHLAVSGIESGMAHLWVPHTTAAITVNSALDPATSKDLISEIRRLVPTRIDFEHQYDTPADAAAHIKATLVGNSLSVIINESRLILGGSQSILFCEFDGPRKRRIHLKLQGD